MMVFTLSERLLPRGYKPVGTYIYIYIYIYNHLYLIIQNIATL